MTQQQEDKIREFLDNLPQEVTESLVGQIIKRLSIYVGMILFFEEIRAKYEQSIEKGKSLEEIAKEVKKVEIGEEKFRDTITGLLQGETNAELFAQNFVKSIPNSEIPKVILDKLDQLNVEVDELLINIIVTSNDVLISNFFDLDFNEWKNNIIDLLVIGWDELNN